VRGHRLTLSASRRTGWLGRARRDGDPIRPILSERNNERRHAPFHHHVPCVRASERRDNVHGCLRVVLPMRALQDSPQARTRRLLCVLLLLHQQVPSNAAVGLMLRRLTFVCCELARNVSARLMAGRANNRRRVGGASMSTEFRGTQRLEVGDGFVAKLCKTDKRHGFNRHVATMLAVILFRLGGAVKEPLQCFWQKSA
jgi:hypothetical protein